MAKKVIIYIFKDTGNQSVLLPIGYTFNGQKSQWELELFGPQHNNINKNINRQFKLINILLLI